MQACTSKMNLSEEVDLEDYVSRPDKVSNAEIAAICQVGLGWRGAGMSGGGACRPGSCTFKARMHLEQMGPGQGVFLFVFTAACMAWWAAWQTWPL